MENIHVLPTDKPSRLCKDELGRFHITESMVSKISFFKNQNICITNDEKPKQGDWVIYTKGIKIHCKKLDNKEDAELANIENSGVLKIILTTDPTLIANGVQAINDEFLEWFVKNPSCEEVEIADLWKEGNPSTHDMYQIIIPKEEPKQEPGKETADYIDRHIVEALVEVAKQEIIEEGISDYDITSNIRYGDNVGERIKIKATIKSIESNKESFEEATENWLDKYSEKFDIVKSSQLPFCFNNRNELNELIEEVSKWQQEQDRNKLRELAKFRNELYEQLPTGKVNAFDLIKIINNHINRLDELI